MENGGIRGFVRVLPVDIVHGIDDDLIGEVFDMCLRSQAVAMFRKTEKS